MARLVHTQIADFAIVRNNHYGLRLTRGPRVAGPGVPPGKRGLD